MTKDFDMFRNASFDLLRQAVNDNDNLVIKRCDDTIWIRFTTIGALLDYTEQGLDSNILEFCRDAVVFEKLARLWKAGDD